MKKINIKTITRENVHGVIATDDKNIWITGNYGTIHHSSDGGVNWTQQETGVEKGIIVDGVFLAGGIQTFTAFDLDRFGFAVVARPDPDLGLRLVADGEVSPGGRTA